MHGIPRTKTWTELAATLEIGSNEITVTETTDWLVGDEIVVASTSYDHYDAETFKILAITDKVMTLNTTAIHEHLGISKSYYKTSSSTVDFPMRAEVGLFTRNIKI